jgi:hypothetical protein
VGRLVEDEDGVARVGLEPVLCADGEVGVRFEFSYDFPILIPQHSFQMVRLQACPGEAFCGDSVGAEGMSQDIWSPDNPRFLGGLLHHPLSSHAASAKQGDCPGTFEMDIVSVSDKNEMP